MTPAELLALADAATDEWYPDVERHVFASRDAKDRLIALAPDLARLCAEMGEALERVYDHVEANFPASVGISPMFASARAALAKLSELKP